MKIQTAVQQIMLGTVLKNEKQAAETLRLIREAGYDGIELNGFMIRPSGMLVRLLTKFAGMPTGACGKFDWIALVKEAGLSVVSIHEDLGTIQKKPEQVIEEAKDFGTDRIVITGMYRFDYSDPASVKRLTEDLNSCGKQLAEEGVRLFYHNHNCELLRLQNEDHCTAYDYIIQNTDPEYVNFELDSYWLTDGGANVPDIMRRIGSRMKLWHINDRGARISGPQMTPILKYDSMELGFGCMDLDALVSIAKENGIEAVILESHRNWAEKSPLKSLMLSSEYLKSNFS